jgi:hypothetical protein
MGPWGVRKPQPGVNRNSKMEEKEWLAGDLQNKLCVIIFKGQRCFFE